MILMRKFPSVVFWPCRLQSYQMSIKGEAVRGRQGGCPLGTWWEAPGFYFLRSWLCDIMATMTGCWAGVTWCRAESAPPSSSIFGRLAWGSPGCSVKVSTLGCLITSTGGELEAWAARIWRGLLRPEREMRKMELENYTIYDFTFKT